MIYGFMTYGFFFSERQILILNILILKYVNINILEY